MQSSYSIDRVLCAVDATGGGHQAMRQAIAVCRRGGVVDFVGLLPAGASNSEGRRLRMALDGAARAAELRGRSASTRFVRTGRPSESLLRAARTRDMLVIAATDRPDEDGLGRVATEISHRCPSPLLLARRATRCARFPSQVLLASDGSPGSWFAAEVCAALVAAHASRFDLMSVSGDHSVPSGSRVRGQVRMLGLAGAIPDQFLERPGDVPGRICQAAINDHASLLVVGRGSTSDRSRLGPVAESVAHRAACSVLLASRPGRSYEARSRSSATPNRNTPVAHSEHPGPPARSASSSPRR